MHALHGHFIEICPPKQTWKEQSGCLVLRFQRITFAFRPAWPVAATAPLGAKSKAVMALSWARKRQGGCLFPCVRKCARFVCDWMCVYVLLHAQVRLSLGCAFRQVVKPIIVQSVQVCQ